LRTGTTTAGRADRRRQGDQPEQARRWAGAGVEEDVDGGIRGDRVERIKWRGER
jgi:hypothetical protein